MTWTYTPAQLATSQLFQVRFLIGDTITADQQLQDEEINWAISQESNVYAAGANCCRSLAAKLSRQVDAMVGEQRLNYSNRARAYNAKAAELDNLSVARGGGLPFAGAMTNTQKAEQETNTDRVQPQFQIGMTDNWLPVGPAGNEAEDAPGN